MENPKISLNCERPAYGHCSNDFPLHLHIDREMATKSTNNSARIYNASVPWVPPPAKTTRKCLNKTNVFCRSNSVSSSQRQKQPKGTKLQPGGHHQSATTAPTKKRFYFL